MIDATTFPDVETAVVESIQPFLSSVMVSNKTPKTIPAKLVTVGASGGRREWGEASANVGVNVYATDEDDCRELVGRAQDVLASISNDLIEHIEVPTGGVTVTRQTPPYQRYFVITVWLRGQAEVDLDLS